ncbi:MAG: RNA-binding S4 domain-containing protein [Pseudomonadota bacterium]
MNKAVQTDVRLDKWLWFTRFYKTRSLATAAVRGGHVKLNGERPKPGVRIKAGDRLLVAKRQLEYEVVVLSLPHRRGPAAEAQTCYQESDASQLRRAQKQDALKSDRLLMPTTQGRPDKHTRRALRSRSRSSQN